MYVLITGAAGMIGRKLVARLAAAPPSVASDRRPDLDGYGRARAARGLLGAIVALRGGPATPGVAETATA